MTMLKRAVLAFAVALLFLEHAVVAPRQERRGPDTGERRMAQGRARDGSQHGGDAHA